MKRENLSVEQMCRNLLEAAYRDGITSTAEAQFLSAGELVGMANLLNEYLAPEGAE